MRIHRRVELCARQRGTLFGQERVAVRIPPNRVSTARVRRASPRRGRRVPRVLSGRRFLYFVVVLVYSSGQEQYHFA